MKKKTVCLNMIVKDESAVIQRCLNSVKALIDYWVIVDTGSSDGTRECIQDALKGIPGELHAREWVSFDYNRNEALAIAKNKGDYLLLIDADDQLVFFDQPLPCTLERDYYFCPCRYGNRISQFVLLVNNRLDWKYIGVIHEGIYCENAKDWGVIENVTYQISQDGARSRDLKKKYSSDIGILEKALEQELDPLLERRYLIHLAESYEVMGEYALALKNYKKRSNLDGAPLEVFFSLYRMGVLQEKLQMPEAIFLRSYIQAYLLRPKRAEPLFCLANYYIRIQCHLLGYLLTKLAIQSTDSGDCYDNEIAIHEYGLLCQLAECAVRLGRYQETYETLKKLLDVWSLPPEMRDACEKNIALPVFALYQERSS